MSRGLINIDDYPYEIPGDKNFKGLLFLVKLVPLDDAESNLPDAPLPQVNCTTEIVMAALGEALEKLCLTEKLVIIGIESLGVVKRET